MAESNEQLAETIAANAAKPKRIRTDAGEVERHSVRDQIEAAKFARQMAASESPWGSVGYAQAQMPGGTG